MFAQMNLFVYGSSVGNRHVRNKTRQVTILISQKNPSRPPPLTPLSQKQHLLSTPFSTVLKGGKKRGLVQEGK